MSLVRNPILRGFNPDPSIIRVEDDFYIATSTFEWYPGVQIHHSRDLINWTLVARPLRSQIDLKGNPDSCGVWAPCLSYADGIYYLVYSNVRSFDGVWKDTPNYLITNTDILGNWSDPIFLSSSGFDGSLFHDDDGRKWYCSMLTDHRQGKFFGGVILQEYDPNRKALVGESKMIFPGSDLGCTEAPHIYKKNEFYYLMTAEGGTEYGHAVTMARSRDIRGPYSLHPKNPIITARHDPSAALQKCGHADLIDTKSGDWYAVFLVGRPLLPLGRCTLGRETAIEQVKWEDDNWLYLKPDLPRLQFELNQEEVGQPAALIFKDDFDDPDLDLHFQSLRVPIDDSWISLTDHPGWLRLYGRESLSSLHEQSLLARRVQHFKVEASTCLCYHPRSFQQMAGLVCYYNTGHWYYLHLMGGDDGKSKFLQIISCNNFNMEEVLANPIELSDDDRVYLKARVDLADLQFYYATEPDKWQPIGPVLDFSILSDDYVREGSERYRPAFTGSFIGICCQDLSGQRLHAEFDWFDYREID